MASGNTPTNSGAASYTGYSLAWWPDDPGAQSKRESTSLRRTRPRVRRSKPMHNDTSDKSPTSWPLSTDKWYSFSRLMTSWEPLSTPWARQIPWAPLSKCPERVSVVSIMKRFVDATPDLADIGSLWRISGISSRSRATRSTFGSIGPDWGRFCWGD